MYSVSNPPFPDKACKVFDVNGVEYFDVVQADEQSGKIIRYKVEDGYLIVDPKTNAPIQEEVMGKPPLRFEKDAEEKPLLSKWRYLGCTCKEWVNSGCPLWSTYHKRDREEIEKQRREKRLALDVERIADGLTHLYHPNRRSLERLLERRVVGQERFTNLIRIGIVSLVGIWLTLILFSILLFLK